MNRASRFLHRMVAPKLAVRFHAVWLVVWLVPGSAVTILWLSSSVAWVSWMSLYAIVIGHWSAMQGALAEQRIKKQSEPS